jgi:hypothetical protein
MTAAGETQRYMHLSPAAVESAIRLLDAPNPAGGPGQQFGNMLATAGASTNNSNH